MAEKREVNFLSVPPCPFRRVSFGTAQCSISTDSHVSDIDPLTCLNCEIPGVIGKPRCRFLSLGTELKPYRGEGKLVAAMACRALNIRLYSLRTCDECQLYNEVPSLSQVLLDQQDAANIQISFRDDLVDEIARDIKLDYGIPDDDAPPLRPIRCWRFPEGYCRKFPVYTRGKVTVVLKHSSSNNEFYRHAILPALREMNLQAYRIGEELLSDEEMCRVCENVQEGDYAIFSLDDWCTSSVFLIGMLYGLGSRVLLLKSDSLQPVPLTEYVDYDLVHYASVGELKQNIMEHLMPYVRPSKREAST